MCDGVIVVGVYQRIESIQQDLPLFFNFNMLLGYWVALHQCTSMYSVAYPTHLYLAEIKELVYSAVLSIISYITLVDVSPFTPDDGKFTLAYFFQKGKL